jgi:Ca2+-binding EF-hand superfamily protein
MKYHFAFTFVLACFCAGIASGQPPFGGGDRGSRGGGFGDRGSFGGGPPGGGFGDRGSFGGGPPGGGPPGGGPPGGGFGDRGGFDPSSFLDRLDRNGNGMLDKDEMEGPAQFILSRLQRDDPSIDTNKPISIKKIKEKFEKMRSGGGSSDDRDRDRDRDRDSDSARREAEQKVNDSMMAAPLVPGFGAPDDELVLAPVLGFGPSAELMAVEVTPEDLKSAEEMLRRYDRNGDGALAGDEISSRFSGNPLDFDRNGDKKLSLNELAIRAARRRVVESSPEVASIRKGGRDDDRRSRSSESSSPAPIDYYNGRKSYLTNAPKLPEGLPGWFASRDVNGDMQVEMSEYSSEWSSTIVEEFNRFDLNGDGFVTVSECIKAVESGASASSAVASPSTPSVSSSVSSVSSTQPTSPVPSGPSKLAPVSDEKLISYAQKIVSRYDKNGDGALTASEWQSMLVDPTPADGDKDGRITIAEYAAWMAAKSAR